MVFLHEFSSIKLNKIEAVTLKYIKKHTQSNRVLLAPNKQENKEKSTTKSAYTYDSSTDIKNSSNQFTFAGSSSFMYQKELLEFNLKPKLIIKIISLYI